MKTSDRIWLWIVTGFSIVNFFMLVYVYSFVREVTKGLSQLSEIGW